MLMSHSSHSNTRKHGAKRLVDVTTTLHANLKHKDIDINTADSNMKHEAHRHVNINTEDSTGHKHEAQRHADITNRKYRHADVNTTNTSDIHKSDAQRRGINSVDTVYTQAHRLLTSTQQALHCSVGAKTQSLHNELHIKSSFKYTV